MAWQNLTSIAGVNISYLSGITSPPSDNVQTDVLVLGQNSSAWNYGDGSTPKVWNIDNQLQIITTIASERGVVVTNPTNGHVFLNTSGGGASSVRKADATFWIDEDNEIAFVVASFGTSYNNTWIGYASISLEYQQELYQIIKGLEPPTYTWRSVPSVTGKYGTQMLTRVRDDSILTDGSLTLTPDQVIIEEVTRVGHITANVPIGNAVKGIFSGAAHFLGIHRDTDSTNTVYMQLVENFTRRIFTSSFVTNNVYIGFIADDENQVGRVGLFFPQYDVQTQILTGYTVNFTDTDYSETDIYTWLLGGMDIPGPETNEPDEGTNPDPQPDIAITGITKPSYGAIDTGFTTMFRMSKTQLQELSAFLWSENFVTNVKKFFNDPREILVGLSIMPVIPDTESEGSEVKAGGIATGVYGLKLTDQYKFETYGVIDVKAEKGNFLDYADTTVTAHLPFVGSHSLDTSDVMGRQLRLKYIFDFLSGSCVAEIDVYVEGEWKPRYFFGGSCGIQIPTSSEDFSKMYSSILSAGATLGSALSTIASGGLTAPLLLGNASNMLSNGMNGHPTVDFASGSGSINGMIGCKTAYLVISRPKEKIANSQNSFVGKPSYITRQLGVCHGFTKCFSVHLDNIECWDEERNQIEQALKNGVRIETGSSLPEYTLTDAENTEIVFLKCVSDRDVIGKTWKTGEHDYTVIEGKRLFDTSILNPTFFIGGDVSKYNYCYIPLFNRFYYITSNTLRPGTISEITLNVDVLQSWKGDSSSGILSNSAILERQESINNAYFNDDMYWTQVNKEVKTVPFLDKDGHELTFTIPENNYILTIAGSARDETT